MLPQSECDGLPPDAVGNRRRGAKFDDVDASPQLVFEVDNELCQVEHAVTCIEVDDEIDVAVSARLAPCHGTEDAHVPSSMPGR